MPNRDPFQQAPRSTGVGVCSLALVAVASLLAAPASAQPGDGAAGAKDGTATYPPCERTPTPSDVEGAKGAHKAATKFFERGDYARAIQYWNDAYSFDCSKPALFLNIASAHEKNGEKEAAILALRLYLERASKDADDRGTVQAKIDNLEASLAPPPPPPVEPDIVEPPPPPPPPTVYERPFGVVPWFVAGGGLLVGAGGAVTLIIAQGKISDAEAACPDRAQCDDPEIVDAGNSGRTLNTVGIIVAAGGGAVLAGGLVWQFLFNDLEEVPADETGLRLAPSIGPTGANLEIRGQF